MDKETTGIVISVSSIPLLGVRLPFSDCFMCPHIIKVKYSADGKDYIKRLWIGRDYPVPDVGSSVKVIYCAAKPTKANFY